MAPLPANACHYQASYRRRSYGRCTVVAAEAFSDFLLAPWTLHCSRNATASVGGTNHLRLRGDDESYQNFPRHKKAQDDDSERESSMEWFMGEQ
jgi:hypothetical protein